jgi:hypothetical protein
LISLLILLFLQDQLQSLFQIEEAYLQCTAQAEKTLERWRVRVTSPAPLASLLPASLAASPTVGQFGVQAERLLDDMRAVFLASTRGGLMVKERTTRLGQLMRLLSGEVSSLFRLQIQSLQFDAEQKMRRELLRLAAETPSASATRSAGAIAESGVNREEDGAKDSDRSAADEARGAVLQTFKARAAPLEVASLGLVVTEELLASVSHTLRQICDDFASSPTARALALRQLERAVQEGALAEGEEGVGRKRRFGAALTVVGLIRPPGLGNLQGVISSTEPFLLGGLLPVSLVLGVQNDADSPEVGILCC